MAGIGEEVRDGKFAFAVTSIETGYSRLGDNPYLARNAQGQYVLVRILVGNVSDRPQTFFSSNQKLIDAQGRTFNNDSMAELNLENNDGWVSEINPGNAIEATVVFDIPADARPAAIELHDSAFSGGVRVRLTE